MLWGADNYELSMTSEDGSRLGMVINVPKFVHSEIPSLYAWENSNSPYFVLALDAEKAWDYVDKMNTHGSFQQIDPHAPSEEDIRHIGGLTFIIARTTHGEIGFSLAGEVPDPPKESLETLVRFAGVFDLAYKRFMDLQKAEAQAREAEIQLALERVRARSLAMHHTSELQEVVNITAQQLHGIGMDINGGVFICINAEVDKELSIWASGGMADYVHKVVAPFLDKPIFTQIRDAISKGDSFLVENFSDEEKRAMFTHLFNY
jgi:hypothetical protein